MTQEEKAKRYDEAIERAKGYHTPETHANLRIAMENLFPELKESEDDVVIRALKSGFRLLEDEYNLKGLGGLKFEKILAWLEKQGEQKPAWSEEDEQYLLVCKNALAKYQTTDKWDANIISRWLENRLKSLKDRYTWKPSKKQIIALRWVLNNVPYCTHKEEISGLLDQIKDL